MVLAARRNCQPGRCARRSPRPASRNVATYINSGNAILATDLDIEGCYGQDHGDRQGREFGFEKDIMLVSRPQWATDHQRPIRFPKQTSVPTSLHVFVLSGAVPKEDAVGALAQTDRQFRACRREGQDTLSPCTARFQQVEAAAGHLIALLRVVSTARNWNTVVKLKELAKGAS